MKCDHEFRLPGDSITPTAPRLDTPRRDDRLQESRPTREGTWAAPPAEEPQYPRPAGFWIRVVATLIDSVVFLPLVVLNFITLIYVKNLPLALIIAVPGFLYKPLLEAYYGGTLGKLACGVRVVGADGNRLGIGMAYVRFLPWLVHGVFGLALLVWTFDQPGFAQADFLGIGAIQAQSPLYLPVQVMVWLLLADCVTAAFTHRKRAGHDFLAESYCVRV